MSRRINCIHHQPNSDAPGGWICGVGVLQRPSLGACENCDDSQKTPDPAFVPRNDVVIQPRPKSIPRKPIMALPLVEWPQTALDLIRCRVSSDKGLGDVLERKAEDPTMREYWTKIMYALIGVKVCRGNCQGILNRRYPFLSVNLSGG